MKFNPKMTLAALGLTSLAAVVATYQIDYTAPKEGLSLEAYLDSVAKPTICYGKTAGVKIGMSFTKEQCEAFLEKELIAHCSTVWKVTNVDTTPVGVFISACDWVYQFGEPRWHSSTLKKHYVSGNFARMCLEYPKWKFAGEQDCSKPGTNCRGVYKRAIDREALCGSSL